MGDWSDYSEMLNENVKKVLKESMWDLATCADNEPNVVPVAFKDVTEGEVVATFKAMVEKMFNGAATAKGAPVFIRAWRSLFWKITTHKFHSYYKKRRIFVYDERKRGECVVSEKNGRRYPLSVGVRP